ncbi:hypothetical protein M426DRAFT_258110 [Hypoxylon sp. CI-4A]|nr:hypothetical protein M426DRAFT_258110 [Hypoxylon sp. CI-4A]
MPPVTSLVTRLLPSALNPRRALGYGRITSRDTEYTDSEDTKEILWEDKSLAVGHSWDSLVISAHHNRYNRLSGLPTEILLQIIGELDAISLFALVRVSRRFSRIFTDSCLSAYHELPDWTVKTVKSLWLRFNKSLITDHRQALRRLNRCSLCRSASIFKEAEVLGAVPPVLHCSGCIGDHPTYLFSEKQRMMPIDERLCIGREGHIKLCRHKSITWKEIERFSLWVGSWANPEFEIHCDKCDSEYRVDGLPFLTVESENGAISKLRFVKRNIIKFNPRKSQLSAKEMQQGLGEAFRASRASWYPENPPSYLSPMRAFDPNACSCLVYDGSNSLDWKLCEKDDPGHTFSCRRSGEIPNPSKDDHLISQYTHSFKSGVGVGSKRFLGMAFRRRSSSEVEMDQFMEISLRTTTVPLGPWLPQWYLAIDPTSYGLEADEKMQGLTWCRDNNCWNSLGLRSGIGRPEAATKDCGDDCFHSIDGLTSINSIPQDNVVRMWYKS